MTETPDMAAQHAALLLRSLLDDLFATAERWALFTYEKQPWEIVYALPETPGWHHFVDPVSSFNKEWAEQASALIYVLSDSKAVPTRQSHPLVPRGEEFVLRDAWAKLALQATRSGFYVNAMVNVDFGLARRTLHVPARCQLEAAIALKPLPGVLAKQHARGRRTPRIADPGFAHEGIRAPG
jgi:hypothetical protein